MGIGVNGTKRGRPSFVAGRRARPAAAPVVRYVALAALGLIAGAGGVAVGSLLVPEHKTDGQYAAPITPNDERGHTAQANAPAEKAPDHGPADQRAADAAPDEPRNDAQAARHVAQERAAEPTGQDQNSAALGGDEAAPAEPSGATGALRKNGSGEASPSQSESREQAAQANAPAEKAADDGPAAQRAAGAAPDEPRDDAQSAHHVEQERGAAPTGQDQNSAALRDEAPRAEPSRATGALRKNGSGEASPSQSESREQAASGAQDEKSHDAAEAPSRSTAALGDKPSGVEKLPPLVAPVDQPPHRTGTAPDQAAPEVKSRQASRGLTVEEPASQTRPSKRPNGQRSLRRAKARATFWHPPARTTRDARRSRLAMEGRASARRLRPRVTEEVVIIEGPEAARIYHVIVPRYPRGR
jgi:hypothetical protein